MAGHSQFANIMYRKGAQDKKRSAMFSKLSREITVAAKMGMPDPDMNPRLRAAVNAAKAQSMPKDNIQRAIDKASKGDGENYEEVRYEGYGPGGVALIVEALTDNRNRTASEVRSIFTKNGGTLGETNSVAFNFQRLGVLAYPASAASADAMFEAALEAGADNVESTADGHEVLTSVDDFAQVRDALEAKFGAAQSAKLAYRAQNTIAVDEETAQTLFGLIEALEDSDDVQTVSANFEVAEDVLAKLTA